MSERGVIIIGAGQAGAQAATDLRTLGYSGPITLAGDEPHLPYYRPPLSKAFLVGEKTADQLHIRSGAYFMDHHINLRLGDRAASIDRAAREVAFASGARLPYDHVVIATGARVRRLRGEGADLDGVLYMRTLADAEEMMARLARTANLVVIGGGFIGLEAAASASKLGKRVTVIEAQERLMARALGPEMSAYFAAAHESHGVSLRLATGVAAIEGERGRVSAVRTTAGERIPADLVLVGIGVIPNAELAAEAGLAIAEAGAGAGAVVVDRAQRSSDPAILAIGDACAFPDPAGTGLMRLESVQNGVDQAKVAAHAIVGQEAAYTSVPWFWSDQYDLKLQMVGLSRGADTTLIRGEVAGNRFSAFSFQGGRLIAIDSINKPADHMRGRKLLAGPDIVTPDDIDRLFAAPVRGAA